MLMSFFVYIKQKALATQIICFASAKLRIKKNIKVLYKTYYKTYIRP